jgi:hypothetical protein
MLDNGAVIGSTLRMAVTQTQSLAIPSDPEMAIQFSSQTISTSNHEVTQRPTEYSSTLDDL